MCDLPTLGSAAILAYLLGLTGESEDGRAPGKPSRFILLLRSSSSRFSYNLHT